MIVEVLILSTPCLVILKIFRICSFINNPEFCCLTKITLYLGKYSLQKLFVSLSNKPSNIREYLYIVTDVSKS